MCPGGGGSGSQICPEGRGVSDSMCPGEESESKCTPPRIISGTALHNIFI